MGSIIHLTGLNTNSIFKSAKPKAIVLYGDFNVLNILYENNYDVQSGISVYPDSTLVYLALRYYYRLKSQKIVSTDLQDELLQYAVTNKLKIFFFGDLPEVLNLIKKELEKKNGSEFYISGMYPGFNIVEKDLFTQLSISKPDILFVGLGAGRQEKWIIQHLNQLKDIPVVISTGGWFRYLSGKKIRAPLMYRKHHLEWFYRLCTEFTQVWRRYFFGAPKFIYRIITGKLLLELQR